MDGEVARTGEDGTRLPPMPRVVRGGMGVRILARSGHGAVCARSIPNWGTAVPPAAHFDTGCLFHGERAPTAPDPGARLTVPDGLVDDERRADDRNEAQGGQSWHLPRDGKQTQQDNGRD